MKLIFENWKKHLLIEGRKDDVLKKYPWFSTKGHTYLGGVPMEEIDLIKYLSDNDPSGNNKYLMWMADRYAEAVAKEIRAERERWPIRTPSPEVLAKYKEDPERKARYDAYVRGDNLRKKIVKNSLEDKWGGVSLARPIKLVNLFHEWETYLKNKDIYSYKSDQELQNALNAAYERKAAIDQKKIIKNAAKEGGKIIWESGKMAVIRPLTKEASCLFGKQTKWCVSADSSYNAYAEYTEEGAAFYFFFLPDHPRTEFRKCAVVVNRGEVSSVWDAQDYRLELNEFAENVWDEYPYQEIMDYPEWQTLLNDLLALCVKDAEENPPTPEFNLKIARNILDDVQDDMDHGFEAHEIKLSLFENQVQADASLIFEFDVKPKLVQKVKAWKEKIRQKDYERLLKTKEPLITGHGKALSAKLKEYEQKIAKHVEELINEQIGKLPDFLSDYQVMKVSSFMPHFTFEDEYLYDKIRVELSRPALLQERLFDDGDHFRAWLRNISDMESKLKRYAGNEIGIYAWTMEGILEYILSPGLEEAGIVEEDSGEETKDMFGNYAKRPWEN